MVKTRFLGQDVDLLNHLKKGLTIHSTTTSFEELFRDYKDDCAIELDNDLHTMLSNCLENINALITDMNLVAY